MSASTNFAANTQNSAYAQLLQESGADECVLCPEKYLARSGVNVLEVVGLEDEAWRLSMNSFPYPFTRGRIDGATPTLGHLMMLPARHITNPRELSDRDSNGYNGWDRIDELFTLARERHGANLGGVCMRYYDETAPWPDGIRKSEGHMAAGLTVAHFHAHILVPDLQPETGLSPGHPSTGQDTPHEEIQFPIG